MVKVPHSLIRFADGELAYIAKRIDRTKTGEKLPMEDFCQLTEQLTEHKYRSSHEQIAKAIMFIKFQKTIPEWNSLIESSFLFDEMRDRYKKLIQERIERIFH